MNKWFGIGRLTKAPELRYTQNEKVVCEFTVAINRPQQKDKDIETDFITCKVWGKTAENLKKYQDKGSLISILGSNRVDTYQDDNGNTKYKNYVYVESIEYLGSKKETKQEAQKENKKLSEDPFREFGEQVQMSNGDLSSELPF